MRDAVRLAVVNYERADTCSPCGGKCCKRMPGAAMPEDFRPGEPGLTERIAVALQNGWAIDWWEGDPRDGRDDVAEAYFLRPAVKGSEARTYHGAWGGECTFLTPTGCRLVHDDRPTGCRLLEPSKDGSCIAHGGTKHEAAIAWLPYRKEIEAAGDLVATAVANA